MFSVVKLHLCCHWASGGELTVFDCSLFYKPVELVKFNTVNHKCFELLKTSTDNNVFYLLIGSVDVSVKI